MHVLLAQLLSQGLLDGWGDTDFDLPHLIKAVALMRRGVIPAALWELRQVECWEERHLKLLKACLGEDILLNALAEDHWGAFPWENQRSLDLMWGALLGPRIAHLHDYYARATCFATRVVGVEHGERWARAKGLKEGTPLLLLPEPTNPYDPNAIHVFTPTGGSIGFIRRTLAVVLAPRLAAGAAASARVACILGENYPMDQRVNIRVEVVGPSPSLNAAGHMSCQASGYCHVSVTSIAMSGAVLPVARR